MQITRQRRSHSVGSASLGWRWIDTSRDGGEVRDLILEWISALPPMTDAEVADRLTRMIEGVCRDRDILQNGPLGLLAHGTGRSDFSTRGAAIRIETPEADRNACRLTLRASSARLTAADAALMAWASAEGLSATAPDQPARVAHDVENTRVRGMAERGEEQLRWRYAPPADPAEWAELTVDWTRAPADD